jgi:hypothetical protein
MLHEMSFAIALVDAIAIMAGRAIRFMASNPAASEVSLLK